jgi:hypothetical protein
VVMGFWLPVEKVNYKKPNLMIPYGI